MTLLTKLDVSASHSSFPSNLFSPLSKTPTNSFHQFHHRRSLLTLLDSLTKIFNALNFNFEPTIKHSISEYSLMKKFVEKFQSAFVECKFFISPQSDRPEFALSIFFLYKPP